MAKKSWIFRSIIFIVIMLVWIFSVILPQYSKGYNASMIDKYDRLKSVKEPKIILVGDSNVAFGFNSKLIEEQFNMPVVNMGLHGGLGLTLHTDIVKGNINKGDIVVVLPAQYDFPNGISDAVLAWQTIENHFSLWSKIRYQDYEKMIEAFPTYLKKAVELSFPNCLSRLKFWNRETTPPPPKSVYSRAAFNEYGDVKFERSKNIMKNRHLAEAGFRRGQISKELMQYLNEYHKYVESQGATLFMGVPPIMQEIFEMTDEELADFQEELENSIQFELISDFNNYIYSETLFYNTNLHLNDRGVEIRTQQFIKDLTKAVKN
ncbi:hypothetical protein RBG61_13275 [Paludicola sp. MB14-C6]|uniref:hypothetical protein n=1 Tax=Paludihabitans sp. MB14-C6 TaxID=3070656 RepID=UPI0027DB4B08|nr:hypothetical protein [Paludicola sp. MB14-C6]WMJ22945.1 hypothetical protein RBG61_13275 [Paludicola sp. MB14-C6]